SEIAEFTGAAQRTGAEALAIFGLRRRDLAALTAKRCVPHTGDGAGRQIGRGSRRQACNLRARLRVRVRGRSRRELRSIGRRKIALLHRASRSGGYGWWRRRWRNRIEIAEPGALAPGQDNASRREAEQTCFRNSHLVLHFRISHLGWGCPGLPTEALQCDNIGPIKWLYG